MTTPEPYDLDRFVAAQEAGGSYQRAVAELRAGRKTGHWMWFVFPQVAGLGLSATSQRFAIGSLAEARAYLGHPILGPRLTQCAAILAESGEHSAERREHSAEQVFGETDAMKLRSSMTLFSRAKPGEPVFGAVLAQYFGGEPDPLTDRLLAGAIEGHAS
ncbi:MAG TPA: DUF1810 domain-containing protein [Streptosporangiaceae bacterium]|jgi:uncharacterized protein (DUF1810 family)|nr:DUF1810 domain-containing protein [Streptosporangiaceae bacterium]